MFAPLRTDRLLLRELTLDDIDGLWERRNDPSVAEYQNWTVPYSKEEASRVVAGVVAMDGPEDGEWWMCAVVDAATGETVGDLALHLEHGARTAEIGYTLDSAHWGKGYAVEAAEALVEYLFETLEVTRVFGMLHPDNPASARVLERVGMLFEGHTRNSFWLDGEVSDDWIYGMTPGDWVAWRDRPLRHPDEVRLVEVTDGNFADVYGLRTHKTQESFVAPVAKSLGQALVAGTGDEPVAAWYRAVEADGVVAGFVMVALGEDEPFLWRLLIDRTHQRRGIGRRAIEMVEREMRSLGHEAWLTSWVPGRGSPEPFYRGLGFEPTGEVDHGEVVGRKAL